MNLFPKASRFLFAITQLKSNLFSVVPLSIGYLIDGDEILAKMSQNLASDPNYIPSDEDSIKLALAVFGQVK
jgi:hypothetical protein